MQSSLKIKAVVNIKFVEEGGRDAIMNALIPDNTNFPEGLTLKMSPYKKELVIEVISSPSTKIETLIATIDEVLEHITVAKKVIENA